VVPGVSADSVTALQPSDESTPPSNVQLMVTLLVYQPLRPSVPKMVGVMIGGEPVAALGAIKSIPTSALTKISRRKISRRPLRRSNLGLAVTISLSPVA
jgi:hypothetical protein